MSTEDLDIAYQLSIHTRRLYLLELFHQSFWLSLAHLLSRFHQSEDCVDHTRDPFHFLPQRYCACGVYYDLNEKWPLQAHAFARLVPAVAFVPGGHRTSTTEDIPGKYRQIRSNFEAERPSLALSSISDFLICQDVNKPSYTPPHCPFLPGWPHPLRS